MPVTAIGHTGSGLSLLLVTCDRTVQLMALAFMSLCQTLVKFGERYGQFDVTRELPDRTSLARHVPFQI